MKKVLLSLFAILCFSATYSQTLPLNNDNHCSYDSCKCINCGQCGQCGQYSQTDAIKFRPYVSIGTGLSVGISTHAIEAGIWNNSVWFSGLVEYTPSMKTDSTDYLYSGLKAYKKVYTSSKLDFFVYGATKIGNNTKTICFEPGFSSIYNITENLAFQWSFSTPIYEGLPNKTVPLNTSICFNWFF